MRGCALFAGILAASWLRIGALLLWQPCRRRPEAAGPRMAEVARWPKG